MVKFDELTHTYTDENNNILISTTQLMQRMGIAPDYSSVNSELLNAKAQKGTLIHKEIEEWIKEGKEGFTRELYQFQTLLDELKLKAIASELMVANEIVAGTIDLILEHDGERYIADIKTTSVVHRESVSWQLSIYRYLLGDYTINDGYVFHLTDEGAKVERIALKTKEQVEDLINSYLLGEEKYTPQFVNSRDLALVYDLEQLIVKQNEEIKRLEEQKKLITEKITIAMKDNNLASFDNGKIKFTLTPEHTKKSFDSKRFEKENPELFEEYTKTSKVKESLRITIR